MIATGTAGAWFSEMQSRTVDVSLPKFRAESEFPLRDTLAAMGMPSAFSQTAADFSGIDDRQDLFLSYVIQKAFVDIAEEGTEAAAATGIAVSLISAVVPQQKIVFRADHPFLFLIRDTHSGGILFVGRLMNPR